MTETTDIKALTNERLLEIKSILSGFEDGYDTVDDKENYEAMRGAQLLIDELISLRDQLEAELQRADEFRDCVRVIADQLSVNAMPKAVIEAVAELAALRGTQEPVGEQALVAVADLFVVPARNGVGSYYVTDAAEARRISKRNDNSAIRQYITMQRYQELFTHPAKPVVALPKKTVRNPQFNAGVEACRKVLEAAGIVVKDGE